MEKEEKEEKESNEVIKLTDEQLEHIGGGVSSFDQLFTETTTH